MQADRNQFVYKKCIDTMFDVFPWSSMNFRFLENIQERVRPNGD